MTRQWLGGFCSALGGSLLVVCPGLAVEPATVKPATVRPALRINAVAPAKAVAEEAGAQSAPGIDAEQLEQLKKFEDERKQAAESLQKVRESAPFQQTRAITLPATNARILGFCVLPDDRLVVISGAPETYGGISLPQILKGSQSESQLQWLDVEGKVLNSVVLDFKPKAVNSAADGSVFVVGEGVIARFDGAGKKVAQVQSPHIADVLESPEKFEAYVMERHEEEVASLEEQSQQYQDALKELAEKPADQLSKQEKRELLNAKSLANAYSQMAQRAKTLKREDIIAKAMAQLKELHRVAVSSSHVFVVSREATGYGYTVWRLSHDLKESKKIVSKLSGCCGQMDIQVAGAGLAIAENSRHRVLMVDNDGKTLTTFGKSSRTDLTNGFGGCCNPMNTCFSSQGALLTSESNGLVKRYTPEGKFQEILGVAKVTEGCKNSSIGISSQGDRLYYFDVQKGQILVLEKPT